MPAPTAQLKIPSARAAQLKALAAVHGFGIAETIEFLLGRAIEAGDVPDVLPGYEVVRDGGLVFLTLEGQRLPAGLLPGMALNVAENLHVAATQLQVGKALMHFCDGKGGVADINYQITVGRHGHGVVIGLDHFGPDGKRVEEDRITASMTTSMAMDLARQIRKAVENA